MKSLLKKYRNILVYTIFGSLASLINILVFNFYHVNHPIIVSNTLAWFVANLFSFFCNKHIVFSNGKHGLKNYLGELGGFFSSRIFSWVVDMAIMYLGIWIMPTHPVIVKIIDQVLIGIFNYALTRIIFMRDNKSLLNKLKERQKKRSNS